MPEDEAKYRSIFEAALDVLMLLDRQGNILDINHRAEVLTGYSRSELLQMNVFEHLIIPEDHQAIRQMLQKVIRGQDQEYEVHWRMKDGRIIPFAGQSTARYSESEFLSTICALRDITARKQAEERLYANEERFRALIENSLDAILLYGADGTINYVSPSITRIIGFRPDELVGKNRFDWIHPDDMEQVRKEWNTLLQEPGKIVESIARGRHKNGSWMWIERVFHNLLDDPNVGAVVVNFRDVTERVQAEEALRQYTNSLEIQHEIDDATLVARAYETLTKREREVLRLAAEGRTASEIAALLFISSRTVESHRARLMRKLELHNQTDLIRFALRVGILPRL